ncbi:hypothetical protein HDE76_000723 [Rhodanobacter sp. ANJX3]|uniref:hypothetical protein n=1 Tax=Rhodanobacter sp. ANJX3 TaxID=2723083 RepID=UPI001614F82D|nr:hypothetical protein [Rhodanobacter sp. ANJX3]MBB5357541.1 hypothetical protein [Rhodanobacter sp. ANJX3]
MTFARRSGGDWATPGTCKRYTNGAWADVANIYRRQGGGWVLAWKAYKNVTGTITPAAANGSASGAPISGNVVTIPVTAQGANGNGSYTYAWSVSNVSSGAAPNIATPNSASTTFSRVVNGNDGNVTFTANCTISDGQSSVVVSVPGRLSYANRN